jgi:hypothetical protein
LPEFGSDRGNGCFVPLPLLDEVRDALTGVLRFVALARGVGRAGAGLEVGGLLQQAGDALHFELDCGGRDAPLLMVLLSHVGMRKAMALETHY